MKTALWANRRHRLWLRALLIVPSLSFIIAPEAWARNGPLRTPSLRLAAGAQTEGAQTARTPSRTLGGRIEDALAKGNPDTARTLVPKFLAEPGVTADNLLRIGANLAQHELYSEAADVFGRCVKDHPELFEGYYNLALAELALRKYPAALATLQKPPRTSRPKEVARTYLRGKIELALGQDAQAEQDLSAAFAAAPQEGNYALDLGLAYIHPRAQVPASRGGLPERRQLPEGLPFPPARTQFGAIPWRAERRVD